MDAGIPQAQARNTDECARVGSLHTFYRLCTRAFARLPARNGELGSPTRVYELRVRKKGCRQQLQNCAGVGANVSFWVACLPGMPVLLQHWIQFTRHTLHLLSQRRDERALALPRVGEPGARNPQNVRRKANWSTLVVFAAGERLSGLCKNADVWSSRQILLL